jgi:adiponectin receptor
VSHVGIQRMPLTAEDVTVEAGQRDTPPLSALVIQHEDSRMLSRNDASDEALPESPSLGAGSSSNYGDHGAESGAVVVGAADRSRQQRPVGVVHASPAGSSPGHRTNVVLNTDVAGSPSESVASPPFFPTSRHHSFFMDDLDSSPDEGDQSPLASNGQLLSWPRKQSPTAAFDGVMARSRSQRSTSPDAHSKNKAGEMETAAEPPARSRAAVTNPPDHSASVLTTSSADHNDGGVAMEEGEAVDAHPPHVERQAEGEEKSARRRRHRHRLVATAPPFDPSRPQQWFLLTMGPDPELPLYAFKEIPHWQKYNPYIRGSYRAFYTTGMCLKSMLGWHNETINVYSHFLTFIVFVVLTVLLYTTVLSKAITAPSMSASKLMYAIFCFGSMLCMLNSAVYHLFNCHSHQRVMTAMGRLDFIGITVLIVASFLPPLYVMFHCYKTLRIIYIASILILGGAAIVGPWTDIFHEHVGLRVATFLGLGFSGLVPSIHSMFLLPHSSATSSVEIGVVLMVFLYCGGVVFYVTQFPESRFPGYFDVWLSSHQIWHFFVSMAALVHYFNCVSMYQMWQISDGTCN